MVGEVEVSVADQSMTVEFLSDHVFVCFDDIRSVRAVLRQPLPGFLPVGNLLSFSEIRLSAKVGKSKEIELFPRPGLLVRLLSRPVREMLGVPVKD